MANKYAWLGERTTQAPTIIQHYDGLATVTLSKITSGARLMWVFDEDFPVQLGLFAHLTDDEAQTVFETPPEVGLLERVRATLTDREAFAWRKSGNALGVSPLVISADDVSEEAFAQCLWDAAEAPRWVGETADGTITVQVRSPRPNGRKKSRRQRQRDRDRLESSAPTKLAGRERAILQSIADVQRETARSLAVA
ncbi:MAG TPA: hypothetical protein VIW24_24270 [Aldersonia sp.]